MGAKSNAMVKHTSGTSVRCNRNTVRRHGGGGLGVQDVEKEASKILEDRKK